MVKLILSCDGGGGVRAVVGAQVMADLEKDLGGASLHDRVDLFAGAGTGALTALAVATERLAGKDLVEKLYTAEQWRKLMPPGDWQKHTGVVHARPLYPAAPKTAFLKQKFSTMKVHAASKPIVVPVYNVETRRVLPLGSDADLFPLNVPLVDLADAATATPLYFPPVRMDATASKKDGARPLWLIDASVVCADPSLLALSAARRKWGDKEELRVLSLGCGQRARPIDGAESASYGGLDWLQHDLLGVAMDGGFVASQLADFLGPSFLRIDGALPAGADDLDELTPQNIEALRKLGRDLYQKHKAQLLKFFDLTVPASPKAKVVKEDRSATPKEEEAKKKRDAEEKKRREEAEAAAKKKGPAKKSKAAADSDTDSESESEEERESRAPAPSRGKASPKPVIDTKKPAAKDQDSDGEDEDEEDRDEEDEEEGDRSEEEEEDKKTNGKDDKKKKKRKGGEGDDDDDDDDEEGCVIS